MCLEDWGKNHFYKTLVFLANDIFKLFIRSGSISFGRALDPKDVSEHIDRQSSIFMDADTDRNRY